MLLSRVADALYWISRYLERAEHTARLMRRGHGSRSRPRIRGARRPRSSGCTAASACPRTMPPVRVSRLNDALFDPSHRNVGRGLRDRGARERTPGPRGDQLRDVGADQRAVPARAGRFAPTRRLAGRTHYVSRSIIEGVHLFAGHHRRDDGSRRRLAVPAGRPLPRARGVDGDAARRLPRRRLASGGHPAAAGSGGLGRAAAVVLGARRVLPALHRGRAAGTGHGVPAARCGVPPFHPFRGHACRGRLTRAGPAYGTPSGARAERLSGRLRASLDYAQVDEILAEDPHAYLAGVSGQCEHIHAALYQSYVSYPIESALPA